MNILFINAMKFDYLQDLVFGGFVSLLGPRHIHVYPANPSYMLKIRKYPRNLGYSGGVFTSTIKHYLSPLRYDAVIVGAAKPSAFEAYLKVIHRIPASCPVIFLDGGDEPDIAGDLRKKKQFELFEKVQSIRPFDAVFKREKLLESSYESNVYPCPLTFRHDLLSEKRIDQKFLNDVVFWAAETHPDRTKAFALLNHRFDCNQNGSVSGKSLKSFPYSGNNYLRHLAASKIVINLRGSGWDTLRFWESVSLNAFLITQQPQIDIPNPFIDREHLVYCKNDLSDLIELIEAFLQQPSERKRMSDASKNHFLQHHTPLCRATSILKVIDSLYSVKRIIV